MRMWDFFVVVSLLSGEIEANYIYIYFFTYILFNLGNYQILKPLFHYNLDP